MSTNIPINSSSKPKRYHWALVALHWIIAVFIFVTAYLALGGEGEGRRGGGGTIGGFPTLQFHMLFGITVLILLLVRLIVRWRTQQPEWATTGNALLDKIGALTHWALYLLTIVMVVTGIILATQTNRIAQIIGQGGTTPGQITPGQFQPDQPPPGQFQPGQFPRGDRGFERGGFQLGALHGLTWVLLILLILLHIGAALYHQFFVKDKLLSRMWFGKQYE
jgi:cytochrome b561